VKCPDSNGFVVTDTVVDSFIEAMFVLENSMPIFVHVHTKLGHVRVGFEDVSWLIVHVPAVDLEHDILVVHVDLLLEPHYCTTRRLSLAFRLLYVSGVLNVSQFIQNMVDISPSHWTGLEKGRQLVV